MGPSVPSGIMIRTSHVHLKPSGGRGGTEHIRQVSCLPPVPTTSSGSMQHPPSLGAKQGFHSHIMKPRRVIRQAGAGRSSRLRPGEAQRHRRTGGTGWEATSWRHWGCNKEAAFLFHLEETRRECHSRVMGAKSKSLSEAD